MADIVAHIHTNLLPSVETEVTLLQKDLVLGVFHGFDDTHDFTLQFHQGVDVSVDFFLQVDNLAHGICHSGTTTVGFSRHTS